MPKSRPGNCESFFNLARSFIMRSLTCADFFLLIASKRKPKKMVTSKIKAWKLEKVSASIIHRTFRKSNEMDRWNGEEKCMTIKMKSTESHTSLSRSFGAWQFHKIVLFVVVRGGSQKYFIAFVTSLVWFARPNCDNESWMLLATTH